MGKTWRNVALLAATIVAVTSIPVTAARADILPAVGSPTVAAVAGGFNWTYDITLTATQQVQTSDSFTIYDFGPGSLVSAPVGWTLTTDPLAPATGTSSSGTVTPSQTNALNYTFTYTGGTVMGQADLGNFILFSTSGTSTAAAFMGRGTDQLTVAQEREHHEHARPSVDAGTGEPRAPRYGHGWTRGRHSPSSPHRVGPNRTTA